MTRGVMNGELRFSGGGREKEKMCRVFFALLLLVTRVNGGATPMSVAPLQPASRDTLVPLRSEESAGSLRNQLRLPDGVLAAFVAGGIVGAVAGTSLNACLLALVSGGGVALVSYGCGRYNLGRKIRAALRSTVTPQVAAAVRISRAGLIAQIEEIVDTMDVSQNVLVVSGKRTAGKTTAVKMVFENRSGVVYIDVGPKTRYFSDDLASKLCLDTTLSPTQIARRIVELRKSRSEPLVVVADISTDTPGSIVRDLGNEMKLLVENARGSVAGIVVLSNSSSVFNLGNDQSRKIHLVIDGLTEKEANEYFDKQHVLDDAEGQALRQRIIDFDTTIIGTLQIYARMYISTRGDDSAKRAAVEGYFQRRAATADTHVEQLLKFGRGVETGSEFDVSETRKLVKRLLDAPTPEAGVSEKGLTLPSAAKVAPVLKEYPVLRYNPATERYYWYDERYRLAAKRIFDDPTMGKNYFSFKT